MFGEGVLAVHDHGQRLAVVGLLERRRAAHQHVQDHAERPDVWKKNVNDWMSKGGRITQPKKGILVHICAPRVISKLHIAARKRSFDSSSE